MSEGFFMLSPEEWHWSAKVKDIPTKKLNRWIDTEKLNQEYENILQFEECFRGETLKTIKEGWKLQKRTAWRNMYLV